jgi:phosphonate transport system permease protein
MKRASVLLAIFGFGLWAWWALDLDLVGLIPRGGGLATTLEFFSAALHPALQYQAEFIPEGSPPFLAMIWHGLSRTVVFATAALSLSVVLGLPLGLLASSLVPAKVRYPMRVFIAGMRSVHELLWAVIFLAAFGLNTAGAVFALTIPYAGTLAKVFSEMLDEAPRQAFVALRGLGARPSQAFLGALLPQAAPDMAAYTFYRFECALRSSAVLGFFGYPTLGYYLRLSFENLHYREVWTCLYAILILVVLLELWSSRLRRRFVA